ncbi:MAG: ECF transporter S component [Faecalibacterium sp.]|nr:ECF transporter S component [Faecalibacterium sp.]
MRNTRKIHWLTQLALLIAIELVMWQTPLGYLRTPVLNVSFLTVPVAIGGMLLGPSAGAVLGTVFGFTSLADTFIAGGMKAILFGINPFGCVVVTVVARVLCGWLSAVIFAGLNKLFKGGTAAYALGALSCPLLNTVFFMGFIMLFYYNSDYIQGIQQTLGVGNPISLILAMVGLQGAIELVVCGMLATIITQTLKRYVK